MVAPSDDTPVEEGLRILAKLIARRILMSKRKREESHSESGNKKSTE